MTDCHVNRADKFIYQKHSKILHVMFHIHEFIWYACFHVVVWKQPVVTSNRGFSHKHGSVSYLPPSWEAYFTAECPSNMIQYQTRVCRMVGTCASGEFQGSGDVSVETRIGFYGVCLFVAWPDRIRIIVIDTVAMGGHKLDCHRLADQIGLSISCSQPFSITS